MPQIVATAAMYMTTIAAQRGRPRRARKVTAGSRTKASARPMKNAGSAPRATHSSVRTTAIMKSAKIAWRLR